MFPKVQLPQSCPLHTDGIKQAAFLSGSLRMCKGLRPLIKYLPFVCVTSVVGPSHSAHLSAAADIQSRGGVHTLALQPSDWFIWFLRAFALLSCLALQLTIILMYSVTLYWYCLMSYSHMTPGKCTVAWKWILCETYTATATIFALCPSCSLFLVGEVGQTEPQLMPERCLWGSLDRPAV